MRSLVIVFGVCGLGALRHPIPHVRLGVVIVGVSPISVMTLIGGLDAWNRALRAAEMRVSEVAR